MFANIDICIGIAEKQKREQTIGRLERALRKYKHWHCQVLTSTPKYDDSHYGIYSNLLFLNARYYATAAVVALFHSVLVMNNTECISHTQKERISLVSCLSLSLSLVAYIFSFLLHIH